MEVKLTCPLGSECEEIKDNKLHRCRWYVCLKGKDPQSEKIIDDWQCAMYWNPIMQVEQAQTNRGQTQALCSFRDEMINRRDAYHEIMVKLFSVANDKVKILKEEKVKELSYSN